MMKLKTSYINVCISTIKSPPKDQHEKAEFKFSDDHQPQRKINTAA